MKTVGLYLMIAGVGSIILSFMDMNFRLLMWIDMWGETVGWIIRGGLTLVGGALYLLIKGEDELEEENS